MTNRKNPGIIIQARLGSSRLPRKVILKVQGQPMICHLINRLKKIKIVTILATTKKKEDQVLINIAKNKKIDYFAGNTNDVLNRYYFAAKKYQIDPIIRITADCPLMDYKLIKKMLKFYEENNYDYVSNTIIPTFPDGLDIEIFSFKILQIANKNAKIKSEREHVTPYIKKNSKKFRLYNFKSKKDFSHIRLTVDKKNDLKLIKIIYKEFLSKTNFELKNILLFLQNNPNLLKINEKNIRNQGYVNSLKKDKIKE